MKKLVRDRKYLDFLRLLPCYICGCQDGTVVGHHLKCSRSGGMGIKPGDNYAIPLCHRHHREVHDSGELSTFLKYNCYFVNRYDLVLYSNNLYIRYLENLEKQKKTKKR